MFSSLGLGHLTGAGKIVAIVAVAVVAHVIVRLIAKARRHFSSRVRSNRTKTFAGLSSSLLVFGIYFVAVGIVIQELGVSVGTYIASASVIGIAVGFGTQNIVQDVINGFTIIMTNLFKVGDMVEISGQVGIVKEVSMRFVILQNPMGANVYIPTRTVTNVINYPKGYVRCLVDITVEDESLSDQYRSIITRLANGFVEQFAGILRADPEIEDVKTVSSGKHFIRVKFRIWPGRGGPIEVSFKQDVLNAIKVIQTNADANSIAVNYEILSAGVNLSKRSR